MAMNPAYAPQVTTIAKSALSANAPSDFWNHGGGGCGGCLLTSSSEMATISPSIFTPLRRVDQCLFILKSGQNLY